MEHVPSGNFSANSAWLQCAVLAHNLIRWTATLGAEQPVDQLTVARTVRTRLIAIPGRHVNLAGTLTLRGPAQLALGPLVQPAPRPSPHPSAHHQLTGLRGLACRRRDQRRQPATARRPTPTRPPARSPAPPLSMTTRPRHGQQPGPNRWIEVKPVDSMPSTVPSVERRVRGAPSNGPPVRANTGHPLSGVWRYGTAQAEPA